MTIITINHLQDLKRGVDYVCQCEPAFEKVIAKTGLPPLRRKLGGLAGLLEIITEQQISVHAAASIWKRFDEKFAPFDLETLIATSDEGFINCGQSRPKVRTIRAVLEAISTGNLNLENLHRQSDKDVAAHLTAIKGIGPWTAQIYLLSNLGRSDVWPVGDLALQESAKLLFNLDERPDEKRMTTMAEPWQPWRAVAARILWSHYRLVRFEGGVI
jgi:DNA-3-methyladenine glycosylase II